MAKPRIFVSSTYYDLRHIRDRLEHFIEQFGYEAVLFESGDIPFKHDAPLDESCYSEVESCHILILIIGQRYGSEVSDNEELPQGVSPDEVYEFYNSITKKEYETARDQGIPVFIFVDKGVNAEYQTFKRNKKNTTIDYAHVDNVAIFKLLEEIISQRANNFVKEFERFDDIGDWLKDQWAGLFAESLSQKKNAATMQDVSSQVSQLRQVTEALKEYSEVIIRRVEPKESEAIISKQHKKILSSQIARFGSNRLVSYIRNATDGKSSNEDIYAAFLTSTSIEDFMVKAGMLQSDVEEFLEDLRAPASSDYEGLREDFLGDRPTPRAINQGRRASNIKHKKRRKIPGDVPITEIGLREATLQSLLNADLHTVADVRALDRSDLVKINGIGRARAEEIYTRTH